VLIFRFLCFDTRRFAAGITLPTTIPVFEDPTKVRPRISNEPEPDNLTHRLEDPVIRWILASPARPLLFAAFGVPESSFAACRVAKPLIQDSQQKPGDIDLFLCQPSSSWQSVAVQAKAVKVQAISWEEDKVNRLPDLAGAVIQANRTRNLGFHRTYLLALILCDAQERRHHNIPGRRATERTFYRIWEFPGREDLQEDVGLVFVEIIQPTIRAADFMATVAVAVARPASPMEQRATLTDKVNELLGTSKSD